MDGGCFEGIESLLQKNSLPNFKKLIKDGVSAKLKVTIPPVTIPSWPCLFSGLTPEQLGYYFFDHPKKGLFSSKQWQDQSIFSIPKIRQFVLNVPGTYPAWKINGEMITGMMSPKLSCFPSELNSFIRDDWIIDGETVSEIFRAFEIKKRLFLRKLREDFDLMSYVIRMPDVLSHHTHLSTDMVNSYISLGYKKIDDFLGEILANNSFDNLFIFSDHGLKFYGHEFNLRRWLEKNKILYINKAKGRKFFTLITKIYDNFRPFIKIDYRKYHFLKTTILKNIIDDSISIQDKVNDTSVVNFLSNVGGLFLKGIDKNKNKMIIESLKMDRRVKEVESMDIEGFPDLFIILKEKYIFNHQSSLFVTRRRNSINHSQFGFFIAYGKNIRSNQLKRVNYIDIAPTIIKLFGIDKMDFMKGNPLNIYKKNYNNFD
ncbi:MAG: alkaline phosphatase family protein [Candidatus Hermodarchaeota archaeon]